MVPPPSALHPPRSSREVSLHSLSPRWAAEPGSWPADSDAVVPSSWGRLAAAVVFNATLLVVSAALFWWQSWKDNLPVPRPSWLPSVPLGQMIQLDHLAAHLSRNTADSISARPLGPDDQDWLHPGQATLFHFANPDCPCSKYMEEHVRELYKMFGDRLRFVAVLPSHDQTVYQSGVSGLFPHFRVVSDPEGMLARAMGVYATPTAVLLDEDYRLVYRGNYNQGRFCMTVSSQYARQAIEAFLEGRRDFQPPPQALSSIGCPLPMLQNQANRLAAARSSQTSLLALEEAR
ncbi:alkyl hydroperoxide reductase/ Thiol specific antioxidant/ Mal allergen [Isosphaera pallida ATCC 43644]|uniref:Alkyl hydroperoxide reductase/ Thiol specific antioxidant/ Mal allergen n=1 Tax=Isosphaera pallida (strain ATCC 43644 / DSM 9630 / IS1B) TaxID=575540 RepID=E8R387_ISOPI|nr:alkyl hydroperoxide reductase/ Thiol specific antioxidant/ Mal allergen [Isosphaera pallida ATCC 43644]